MGGSFIQGKCMGGSFIQGKCLDGTVIPGEGVWATVITGEYVWAGQLYPGKVCRRDAHRDDCEFKSQTTTWDIESKLFIYFKNKINKQ